MNGRSHALDDYGRAAKIEQYTTGTTVESYQSHTQPHGSMKSTIKSEYRAQDCPGYQSVSMMNPHPRTDLVYMARSDHFQVSNSNTNIANFGLMARSTYIPHRVEDRADIDQYASIRNEIYSLEMMKLMLEQDRDSLVHSNALLLKKLYLLQKIDE